MRLNSLALIHHGAAAVAIPIALGLVAIALSSGIACAQMKTIPLASGATAAVLHKERGKLYADDDTGLVVVDTSALTVATTIPTARGALLLDEPNDRLYVLHPDAGATLDVVDTSTDAIVKTIALPTAFYSALEYDAPARRLYAASDRGVAVVDTALLSVITTAAAGPADRRRVCISTASNRLYVVGTYSDTVTILDATTYAPVTSSPISVGHRPWTCAVDGARNRVVVANRESFSISVIDGATNAVAATIPVNGGPSALFADGPLNLLAVGGGQTVSMFALDTLAPITEVGSFFNEEQAGFALDPSGVGLIVNSAYYNGRPEIIELRRFKVIPNAVSSDGHTLVSHRNRCIVIGAAVTVYKCPSLHRGWDLNDDGYSDLAWYNTATKENALTLNSGTSVIASAVTLGPSDWVPVVRGDLDGDGHGDLVFRNATTQATAAWFMNGLAPKPGGAATILGPSNYAPLFAVECGYGIARCLVWRDAVSGSVAYWYMPTGPTPAYAQVIYAGGPGWTPMLTGDFDGNDYTDFVWQHSDGSVAVWLMQGDTASGFSAKAASVILGPGSGWVPKIVADFDGDGLTDILWQHTVTNTTAIWLMDGVKVKPDGARIIMDGATGWTVTHSVTDRPWAGLLWRHSSGATAFSYSIASQGDLLTSDPNWRITHAGVFDVNGRDSLLWRNDATGETQVWVGINSQSATAAILSGDPNWRVVPAR